MIVIYEMSSGRIVIGDVIWNDKDLGCVMMRNVYELNEKLDSWLHYIPSSQNLHSFSYNAIVSSSLPSDETLKQYKETFLNGTE